MMASLIHKNRFASAEPSASILGGSSAVKRETSPLEDGSAMKKPRRRLHLDASFRPIRTENKEEGDAESDHDQDDTDKSDDGDFRPGSEDGPHATLVVCPVSLMRQWKEELERSSRKRSLTVQSTVPSACLGSRLPHLTSVLSSS